VPGERGHTAYGRFQRYFETFLKGPEKKDKKSEKNLEKAQKKLKKRDYTGKGQGLYT
jgi:hypothetical protein